MTDLPKKQLLFSAYSNDSFVDFCFEKKYSFVATIPKYQSKLNTFASILCYHLV